MDRKAAPRPAAGRCPTARRLKDARRLVGPAALAEGVCKLLQIDCNVVQLSPSAVNAKVAAR